MKQDNQTRLHEAGLINKEQMQQNQEEFNKLSNLSDAEVDTLINVHKKLGGNGQMTQADTSSF